MAGQVGRFGGARRESSQQEIDVQRSKIDVWVGLFVMIGAAAILFLALQSANLLSLNFQPTYRLDAKFADVGGLKPKAAVRSAGVLVGRVEEISFDDKIFRARVTMAMDSRFAFPKDSSLKILTSGLLGEQYLGLEPGADEKNLAAGDTISNTQSAVVLENLIGQFLFNSASGGELPGKQGQEMKGSVVPVRAPRCATVDVRQFGHCWPVTAVQRSPILMRAIPIESFNRGVFAFNEGVDKAVFKPAATVYRDVTPALVRRGVGNFLSNLDDAWSFVNNVLQFKGRNAHGQFLSFWREQHVRPAGRCSTLPAKCRSNATPKTSDRRWVAGVPVPVPMSCCRCSARPPSGTPSPCRWT